MRVMLYEAAQSMLRSKNGPGSRLGPSRSPGAGGGCSAAVHTLRSSENRTRGPSTEDIRQYYFGLTGNGSPPNGLFIVS